VLLHRAAAHHPQAKEHTMGKYFLGWLLGIPAVVLVAIWLFFG
jgi:hypothetical protein